jgi:hypothetical protein
MRNPVEATAYVKMSLSEELGGDIVSLMSLT